MTAKPKMLDWADFPDDFARFELDPTGCELMPEELAPGVYALMSSIYNVDNAGFVVGDKGVLVIDAHISRPMGEQILERVRSVTDKPILYLANTNYHGDHTFGNCVFPDETLVIQQRESALRSSYLDDEMAFLGPCVDNPDDVFKDVTYRGPDIIFEDKLVIDLGGQNVELHWFGPANTPGDTIVYVPSARAAWTGNMTTGAFGLALESDAPTYMKTLAKFVDTLDVDTLISGHAPLANADILSSYMKYFGLVTNGVKRAIRDGLSLDATMAQLTIPDGFGPPPDHARPAIPAGRHAYNVRRTYLALSGT